MSSTARFQAALKRERTAQGLTQDALAELANCKRQWVGALEGGITKNVLLSTVDVFAEALGKTASEMLAEEP